MGNLTKVKFKKEVIEYIRSHDGDDNGWIDIQMFGVNNCYTKKFDVPYFVVEDGYSIVEPIFLNEWCVSSYHVEPYFDFEIKLDDGLFDI